MHPQFVASGEMLHAFQPERMLIEYLMSENMLAISPE